MLRMAAQDEVRGIDSTLCDLIDFMESTIDARKFIDANAKKWGFGSGVDNELNG